VTSVNERRSTEPPDRAELERALRGRLAEVRRQIASLTAPPEQAAGVQFGKRVGEGTTEAISRFNDVGVANDLQAIEERLERAIEKLAEGSYGTCDECGAPIAPGRLEARPESVLCVECARRVSRGRSL
jgi:RNA polymerase-binding transcription factor